MAKESMNNAVLLSRVKDLCAERGISLARMERDLGFSAGSSYRWPKSTPGIDRINAVAQYFHVSVDYLCGRTDLKENPESLVDSDLISLQRAIQNLKPEDRTKANNILRAGFEYAFKEK